MEFDRGFDLTHLSVHVCRRMDNLSDEAAELIYRHERGYIDRLLVFRGLFYGMVLNGILGIYYLLKSLGYSLLIPFGMPATFVGLYIYIQALLDESEAEVEGQRDESTLRRWQSKANEISTDIATQMTVFALTHGAAAVFRF